MQILKGLDFDLPRNSVTGIVGESGSGKSTLGRALVRLIEPTAGSVSFDGRDITHLPEAALKPLRRDLQMIFQDPMSSLNPRRTIAAIIAAPLKQNGMGDNLRDRVAEALQRVGLPENFGKRYRHELSGGQRQRVGIARALALSPKFVLADEIVSGLDVSTQAQILTLLEKLAAEMGLTVAFISHDLSVIRRLCKQVIVMRNGVIVEAGPTDALFDAPQHAYTRDLIAAIPLPEIDPGWLDERPVKATRVSAILILRRRAGRRQARTSRAWRMTDMRKTVLSAALLAAGIAVTGTASADSIPGMRGHDHTGITVPDMKQAVEFFTEVVGCKKAMSFGPFADDKGTFMQDLLGVDPKAVIEEITLVRCGFGSNIELFKYTAPDQKDAKPRNSDIGGFHIAFMSTTSRRQRPISTARASRRAWGRCRSTTVRPPARLSSIFRRHGACNWRRSAIRMAWPTRRTPRRFCGAPRTRRNSSAIAPLMSERGVLREGAAPSRGAALLQP